MPFPFVTLPSFLLLLHAVSSYLHALGVIISTTHFDNSTTFFTNCYTVDKLICSFNLQASVNFSADIITSLQQFSSFIKLV
jgi:hypothetical protein